MASRRSVDSLDISSFKNLYKEKAGEDLTDNVLDKLELIKVERGAKFPVNALILLSDDKIRRSKFPYAKIECARFKGIGVGNFIDQKTFDGRISEQADLAMQFVRRHISEGTEGYDGVYRKDIWEYPVIAVREVIRNAVIHRDYSLTGKDIKVAVFDDRIEISSTGLLPPTINYDDMKSRQSDIRNKVFAPVFKRMGITEQCVTAVFFD